MIQNENKTTTNHTTDEQIAAPDVFDKFAAWAKPRLNRLIDNVIDDPLPLLQFLLIDRDNRRTQRNVRRVIERRQEIEMQTERLYLRTGVPQRYPDQTHRQLSRTTSSQRRLPEETEQD